MKRFLFIALKGYLALKIHELVPLFMYLSPGVPADHTPTDDVTALCVMTSRVCAFHCSRHHAHY